MRHPLVMGNWKLNGSRHMVNELVANLVPKFRDLLITICNENPPYSYESHDIPACFSHGSKHERPS